MPAAHQRLSAVRLDERTIQRGTPDQEHERAIAIYDLVERNMFAPAGHDGGPMRSPCRWLTASLCLMSRPMRASLSVRKAFHSAPCGASCVIISWSAKPITPPSAPRHRRRSRPSIWAGAACTTRRRTFCRTSSRRDRHRFPDRAAALHPADSAALEGLSRGDPGAEYSGRAVHLQFQHSPVSDGRRHHAPLFRPLALCQSAGVRTTLPADGFVVAALADMASIRCRTAPRASPSLRNGKG